MSGTRKAKSKSNGSTESSGVITSNGVKSLNPNINKHRKSVANGVDRQEMIATAAYYRAESQGFNGSSEIQDWLEAEKEIENRL